MKELFLTVTPQEYNQIQEALQGYFNFKTSHQIIFKLGDQVDKQTKKPVENGNLQSIESDSLRSVISEVESNNGSSRSRE